MYAKVYSSLWDGTLYGQWEAWSVFVFMLAHSDCDGFIDMHPKAISARSGLPAEVVAKGLEVLESPDDGSRSIELDGRRLERIDEHRDWGWRIVNYRKYREMRDADERRKQNREAQQRRRSVSKRQPVSAKVSQAKPESSQVEAEVEAVSVAKATSCPSGDGPDTDSLSVTDWFLKVFWPKYPRKDAKKDALRAMKATFKGISGEREDVLGSAILSGLRRHAQRWESKDREFIPLPASWINGRRWEDELEPQG